MKLIASSVVMAILATGCAPVQPQRYVYQTAAYNVPQRNVRPQPAYYAPRDYGQVAERSHRTHSSTVTQSANDRELTDGEKAVLYPLLIVGTMAVVASAIGSAARANGYKPSTTSYVEPKKEQNPLCYYGSDYMTLDEQAARAMFGGVPCD